MNKLSKAINKMNKAGKKLKRQYQLSDDPKKAEVEKKLLDAAEKAKEELKNA